MNRTNMVMEMFSPYKFNIDFTCADAWSNWQEEKNYDEELNFLETWLEKKCVDDVCIEDETINVE